MQARQTDILISGSGIAGTSLAHWLKWFPADGRRKASELRTGGHAVDLWGSAVDVVERMGVLPALEELAPAMIVA